MQCFNLSVFSEALPLPYRPSHPVKEPNIVSLACITLQMTLWPHANIRCLTTAKNHVTLHNFQVRFLMQQQRKEITLKQLVSPELGIFPVTKTPRNLPLYIP